MKRIFSIIIAAVLLLALAAMPASADRKPRFFLTGPASAGVGDTITVSLNIEGDFTANIFNIKVNFDPTALRYVSNTPGNASTGTVMCDITYDGKAVSYGSMMASGATSTEGVLTAITFEVLSTAPSSTDLSITVSEFKFLDQNDFHATQLDCTADGLTIALSGGNPAGPTPVPQPGEHTTQPPYAPTQRPADATPTPNPNTGTFPTGTDEPAKDTDGPDNNRTAPPELETDTPSGGETDQPGETESDSPEIVPSKDNGEGQKSSNGKTWFFIIGGALAVILAVGVAAVIVRSAKEKKRDR